MNTWFLLAGFASLLTAVVHCVAGGRYIAQPLLRAKDLHDVPKYVNYFCWHIVSMVLISMAVGFFISASRGLSEIPVLLTTYAVLFLIWNLVLLIWKKQSPMQMIQWALFLPIAVFGVIGLWW